MTSLVRNVACLYASKGKEEQGQQTHSCSRLLQQYQVSTSIQQNDQ